MANFSRKHYLRPMLTILTRTLITLAITFTLLTIVVILIPPWIYIHPTEPDLRVRGGYSFIWKPPTEWANPHIAVVDYAVNISIPAILSAICWASATRRGQSYVAKIFEVSEEEFR